MNLGIVIYSKHSETVWNAFRLANFSLKKGDSSSVFLMAEGVEAEALSNDQFQIKKQMELFLSNGGILFACGTCIEIRKKNSSKLCPISTMADLYEIINNADKIISF
tara:strand:+ start:94 stop:414 length:321 start_codon:yes stop_codon:yes gene_type:complete